MGASLDAYHYSYPPVLLLLTTPLALMAHVPADLGPLIYKPQLGLLIPVALLAGRHWRASEGVAVSLW